LFIFQYIGRIVGAGTHDHLALALGPGNDFGEQFFFFCIGHGGGFTCGAADQDGIRAVVQQPGGEFRRPVRIQGTVFMEEGHHGCNQSSEIGFLVHAYHLLLLESSVQGIDCFFYLFFPYNGGNQVV
jgi:hypothetical protein